MREKRLYLELFWPSFSGIGTEYGENTPSVRIQSECRKMRASISPNTGTFYAVLYSLKCQNYIIFSIKIDNSAKWQCHCFVRKPFFTKRKTLDQLFNAGEWVNQILRVQLLSVFQSHFLSNISNLITVPSSIATFESMLLGLLTSKI